MTSQTQQLQQSTYWEYVGETGDQYRVRNQPESVEAILKNRAIPPVEAAETSSRLQQAYRYFRWALLGILPAGLGTVIFAPLAAVSAFQALRQPSSQKNHRRALVLMSLSTLLMIIGLPLVFLFFLHW